MRTEFSPGDIVVAIPYFREEIAEIYSQPGRFPGEKRRLGAHAAAGGKLRYIGGTNFEADGFNATLRIDTSFFQLADDFDENAFKALLS